MPKKVAGHYNNEEVTPERMAMYQAIGERLVLVRKLCGLTQRDTARILGCDNSTLGKWEAGKRAPDLYVLKEFCIKTRCSLDFIVMGWLGNVQRQLAIRIAKEAPGLVSEYQPDMVSGSARIGSA